MGEWVMMFDIERLVELTKDKYFRMPRGLSREERRMYIKFIASVEGRGSL